MFVLNKEIVITRYVDFNCKQSYIYHRNILFNKSGFIWKIQKYEEHQLTENGDYKLLEVDVNVRKSL